MQRSNRNLKIVYSVQLVKQIKPGLKPGFGLKINIHWTKNQTTRTKNKPAFALKIDAYWTKNSTYWTKNRPGIRSYIYRD